MDAPTFALTDTHREFRDTLRKFAEDRVAPNAAEADRDATFPQKSFDACVELELPALGIPVEYGGAGADMVTQAIMAEELARVCASTSLTLLISKIGMLPVINWGTEELKRKYLPGVASGERQASYCLSEADAGSDVAAMRTRAVRDGDHYVLTGTKHWITNAGVSDIYTVFAVTDPDAGRSRGISCFVVEADWGVEVAPHEDKMGLRGSPTAAIAFDEVRVPAANLVGEEGMGFSHRHAHPGPQPPHHRGPGGRDRPGCHRLRGRLHEGARGVRQGHRRPPGPPVHAGRDGHAQRGGPDARLPGLLAHRQRRSDG